MKLDKLKGDLYVHAGESPVSDEHEWIVQFVPIERYFEVEHYGDAFTVVSDSEATPINEIDIINTLYDDLSQGRLSLELESFIETVPKDEWEEQIDPEDIISSAGLWDLPEFVEWFSSEFPDIDGVITNDGLVVLNFNAFKSAISDADEIEEFLEE